MKKEDLIKQCRYYGKSNLSKEDAKLSFYESCWVNSMLESPKSLTSDIIEFELYLKDFCKHDNVPIGIKAILYNRFTHWVSYDVESFKQWYINCYLKE